jgi:CRP-like cAMP-binding protein
MRFIAADGGVSVVEHTRPGQFFGLASFVSRLPSTYEAQTTAPTRLLMFGEAAYTRLMDEVPGFGRALMAEFARRHHSTLRWLAAARHQGAMERLTLALAQVRREQPQAERDATGAIGLRTTQSALGELAGLSRQTVNELLAQLVQQGRVHRAYGRLWLLP